MKRSAFARTLRARLVARASPTVRAGAERYFKHQVRFLGVTTPGMREVTRELWPALRGLGPDLARTEALALLHAGTMEERQAGVEFLWRLRRDLPGGWLRNFAPVFDATVSDWALCDAIASRVLRPALQADPGTAVLLRSWSRSRNPWRQRVAAVAFVNEARHGEHTTTILAVCARIVGTDFRFTQLGLGWLLRELYLADAPATLAFLRGHLPQLSREALRYATEKMPARLASRLLREHAAVAILARARR